MSLKTNIRDAGRFGGRRRHLARGLASHGGFVYYQGGPAWGWGYNQSSQLAFSGTAQAPVLVQNHSFEKIAAGEVSTAGLKADGTVWTWGGNGFGGLGTESVSSSISPVQVDGPHSFIDVKAGRLHFIALKADGTVWTWGYNSQGQLGDESTDNKSSPTIVHGSHSFSAIGIGYQHSLALKADGSGWAWGQNDQGQLGDSTSSHKSSPTSVVGGHSFTAIDGGNSHTLGLKADGSVWAWGSNFGAWLGRSLANKSSPVAVAGTHKTHFITEVHAGADYTMARRSDSTLCGWGYNGWGVLGDGSSNIAQSSPVVTTTSNYTQIATGGNHVVALRNDGLVYSWGLGNSGQLGGNNLFVNNVIPVPLYGELLDDMSYTNVFGSTYNTYGLRSDGSLWAWGQGFAIGLSDQTARYTPTSLIGTQFTKVAGGDSFAVALKADGSAWGWGENSQNTLADGTGHDRSSPQLLNNSGKLYDIASMAIAPGFTIFVKTDGSLLSAGDDTYGVLGNGFSTGPVSWPTSTASGHIFTSVRAGSNHVVALKADGTAWTWGLNQDGQLGDGTMVMRGTPTQVIGGHLFASIGAGYSNSVGVKADGTAWTWGDNLVTQLGNNANADKSSPVSVVGNHLFSSVVIGSRFMIGLKPDGTAWGWGENNIGQLADGTFVRKSSPVSVIGNHTFVQLAAGGNHAIGLKADGSVWAWGLNSSGELGINSVGSSRSSPTSVVGNHSFIAIQGGFSHSMGLKADGSIWAWGGNFWWQLGDSSGTSKSSPTIVVGSGPSASYSAIFTCPSANTSGAIRTGDNSAWCWGYNSDGNCGFGNRTLKSTPWAVYGTYWQHVFSDVATGTRHTILLKADGTAWVSGLNSSGQLGIGSRTNANVPTQIPGHSFTQVSGGQSHTVGLKSDGSAWTWGHNGQCALGDNEAPSSPGATDSDQSVPVSVYGGHSFIQVSAGYNHTVALKADGTAWAWGNNQQGQLGNNDNTVQRASRPQSVVGGHSFVSLYAFGNSCIGLKSDGTAWTWGINYNGEGGIGSDTVPRYFPTQVVGGHSFVQLAPFGSTARARKSNGQVWAWGDGDQGQIGNNSNANRNSPVIIAGMIRPHSSFTQVAAGSVHSLALKPDGSLLAWGANSSGQLGNGNTTMKSSPEVVVGGHSFVQVYAGLSFSVALKADGSAWHWGNNGASLGNAPVSVGGGHSFVKLAVGATGRHVLGLKSNGSVFAWGTNSSGQLGTNNITFTVTPTAVVGGHVFSDIAAGANHSAGLKANGSLWTWGLGNDGQLGNGNIYNTSSPTAVVGNHQFIGVAAGTRHTAAVKANGEAMTFGGQQEAQLGLGMKATGLSPDYDYLPGSGYAESPMTVFGTEQVHSFVGISAGTTHNVAIKSNGEVWAWGSNADGPLGNNSRGTRFSPVKVAGNHSFVEAVCHDNFTNFLREDGSVWACGFNGNNELTYIDQRSPLNFAPGTSFTKVAISGNHLGAVDGNGVAWGSGSNGNGQLGNSTTNNLKSMDKVFGTYEFVPRFAYARAGINNGFGITQDGTTWYWGSSIAVSPITVVGDHRFVSVESAGAMSLFLKADGTAWFLGSQGGGSGDNTVIGRSSPTSVCGHHSFVAIGKGQNFSAGIRGSDGSLWTWGGSNTGYGLGLGGGPGETASLPTSVPGGRSYVALACTTNVNLALQADGSAWTTGSGPMGDGSSGNNNFVRIPGSYSQVSGSSEANHFVAIGKDGRTYAWGFNGFGQIGINSLVSQSLAVAVLGNHSFSKVSGGFHHNLGLKPDGTVWAWGLNANGQCGDGSTTNRSSPVSVLGDHSFIDVTAGASHSLGLKDDGTVWMWGSGGNSQMGNPLDTAQKTSPVLLVGQTVTTTFADICVGDWHTIGVCPDKTIMAWGWNNSGQLGVGDRTERHSPVTVLGNHSAAAVAAGEQHSLILKADGSVWAWGLNNVGQLGDGSTTSKSSPISVLGGHSFAMIAAAHESSAGLKSDGSLWTWGDGDNYRSGHGDLAHKSTPTQVIGGHVFRKVAVGDGGFMGAIDDSGRIWMWGVGSAGQLGNNASQQQSIPQVVYGNYAPHTFTSIYAGPNFNLATRSDGTLWSWGVGSNGQLGNNDTSSTRSPVSVVGNHSFIKATATMFYGSVVNNASLALKADGTCWAFGASQFVDGTNRSSPVAVAIGRSFIDIAGHSGGFAGLGSDGRVWTWGNDSLILAHATGTTPQSVPGVLATKMAFGSNHGIALKADGTLLSWGSNAFGCLGIGNTLATSVPTSVLGNHTFAAVAAGFQHSAALKADGSAWCWGNNSNGEVGDGTTTHRSSPVSVVGNHSFVEVKAGFQYTIALKSDGSVWGWGNNSNGNVGDNTLTNRSSPVIIGNWPYPGSFAALSAGLSSFGLKSDGKLYGWGQNGSASLGDNSNTDRSLPTAIYGVENAHSFVDIACGASHTIALDSNGAVWGWGSGSLGQNGIGSGVQYASSSIPVLMPGQRKFVSVSAMGNRSAGITNDGCLFAWGDVKATEALDGGDQITSAKSVPVSVTRIFSGQ